MNVVNASMPPGGQSLPPSATGKSGRSKFLAEARIIALPANETNIGIASGRPEVIF